MSDKKTITIQGHEEESHRVNREAANWVGEFTERTNTTAFYFVQGSGFFFSGYGDGSTWSLSNWHRSPTFDSESIKASNRAMVERAVLEYEADKRTIAAMKALSKDLEENMEKIRALFERIGVEYDVYTKEVGGLDDET